MFKIAIPQAGWYRLIQKKRSCVESNSFWLARFARVGGALPDSERHRFKLKRDLTVGTVEEWRATNSRRAFVDTRFTRAVEINVTRRVAEHISRNRRMHRNVVIEK